jgi:hypothetical protein
VGDLAEPADDAARGAGEEEVGDLAEPADDARRLPV